MPAPINPPNDERFRAALRLCTTLQNAGHRALLAGGCVRDMLLGVPPKDYDVATSARPEQIRRLFAQTVDIGAAFGVEIVLLPEGPFEVATFRSDGPYGDGRHPDYVAFTNEVEDARRRDFTINALFYDPAGTILDYVDGRNDLAHRIIRAVGAPFQRFTEDHLRLLRAVRFAARLGYTIDPETLNAIGRLAPLVLTTSAERIRDEILKMLTEGSPRRAFELMDQTGILPHVLPEVAAMKGVQQPPEYHPEGDVYEHTLRAIALLNAPSPTLAMAVLLHDAGKPPTQTFEDRIRFNNHDKAGARIAETLCRRLRMSREQTEQIAWTIEHHMRVSLLPGMRESKRIRLLRQPHFPELLELARVDCLASHGRLDIIDWIHAYIDNLPPEQIKPPRLINGARLIQMGYRPGPLFTQILTAIEDAQLEGAIHTPHQAEDYVKRLWPPDSEK